MIPSLSFVKSSVPPAWKRAVRERLFHWTVEHISGPRSVRLADNQAAVTCVVKNGAYYLDSFVEHYSNLGFRHLFLLDNGSSDGTVDLARRHRNVTVYSSLLPIEPYQAVFKKKLAEMAVPKGWCLDADIDEFLDYPYSDTVGLSEFLEYLNRGGYTAVLAQMLDLFSDEPLAGLAGDKRRERLRDVYRFYDLSAVERVDYRTAALSRTFASGNLVSNGAARLCFGGIRKALFGIHCLLTKHPLFRTDTGIELFPHVHFVNKARLADVSCLLLHYKLAANAYETSEQNKKAFPGTSRGYTDLMRLIEARPERRIKNENAVEYRSAIALADADFLFLSDSYRSAVDTAGRRRSA